MVQVPEQDGVRAPPGEAVGGVTAPAQDAGVAGEERVRHQPDALEVEDHGGVAEPRQPQAHGRIPRWRIHATSCRCTDSAPGASPARRGPRAARGRARARTGRPASPRSARPRCRRGSRPAPRTRGPGRWRRRRRAGPGRRCSPWTWASRSARARAVGQQRVLAVDVPVAQAVQAAGPNTTGRRPGPGHDDADPGRAARPWMSQGQRSGVSSTVTRPGSAGTEHREVARGDDDGRRRLARREGVRSGQRPADAWAGNRL